ncbi:MAG: LamG domain-containing protein, partial [Victivallales bacterium]|nr:LamG domain-containing protein [Victivallales bacterium]
MERTFPAIIAKIEKSPKSPSPAPESAKKLPLGTLGDSLITYCAFDGDLTSVTPTGVESQMHFSRSCDVYQPDMSKVKAMVPRYSRGKFGEGVFIEYGVNAAGGQSQKNFLPPSIGSCENPKKGFKKKGDAKLKRSKGVEEKYAIAIIAKSPKSGIISKSVKIDVPDPISYSFYAKTAKSDKSLTITAKLIDFSLPKKKRVLMEKKFTITGKWSRGSLDFTPKKERIKTLTKENPAKIALLVTADKPGIFLLDALMLEAHHGYGNRRTASSWIPPKRRRASDTLQMDQADARHGSIAFWANPIGSMRWRNLLSIGDDLWWGQELRLDLVQNRILRFVFKGKGNVRQKVVGDVSGWHHYAVVWNGKDGSAYMDGKLILSFDKAPDRTHFGHAHLGGVKGTASPGIRADTVFDEYAYWNRALSDEEIANLAARSIPLMNGMETKLTLCDLEPVKSFARDDSTRKWHFNISNRSDNAIKGVTATFAISDFLEIKGDLPNIPPRSKAICSISWSPSRIMPGKYKLKLAVRNRAGASIEATIPVVIAPARVPAKNAQVITWGGFKKDLCPLGITVGGVGGDASGPSACDVGQATENRLYSMFRKTIWTHDANKQDCPLTPLGKRNRHKSVDFSAPSVFKPLASRAATSAKSMSTMPDVRYMILNTEAQTIDTMDFRPQSMKMVKKKFGLDMTPWTKCEEKQFWAVIHPGGRLSARFGKVHTPDNGIIDKNNPFYAYHRWWHSPDSITEVYLNVKLTDIIHKYDPSLKVIIEPILRRPSLRPYKNNDVSEEWFYYPDPRSACWIQECLLATTRGPGHKSVVSAMPQFLFKPGAWTAPYGGMPPPGLYAETMWHCIARPLANVTYWNLRNAITRLNTTKYKTQEELDTMFGKNATRADIAKKIDRKGENTSVFLWIPELRAEIAKMHNEVIHPLGALLPNWKNAPRKIGVYKSFAGQLYNNIRWSGNSKLTKLIRNQKFPYDVIYDEDFDDGTVDLSQYKVVVIAESPVLYGPAKAAVAKFAVNGGLLLVEDTFKPKIAGVKRVSFKGAWDTEKTLNKKESELLKLYGRSDHPLFIEGMQKLAREVIFEPGPYAELTALIDKKADYPVTTSTRHVFLNFLQAGKA